MEQDHHQLLPSSSSSLKPKKFLLQDILHYLILLLVTKFLKTCGVYICYDILKTIYIIPLLFLYNLINSVILILIQRPTLLNHKKNDEKQVKLNRYQWFRIIKYSFVFIFIKLLWLFGLTLCGPLRTILIYEHSEFVIINMIKTMFFQTSQTSPSRSRGVLLLFIGIFILLAFDHDDLREKLNNEQHPEGHNHGIISHLFYFILSFFNVSDHKGGVLLLVFALLMEIAFNNATKPLINDIGGIKRLKTLSTSVSTILLIPFLLLNYLTENIFVKVSNIESITETHSWYYYLIPLILSSIFIFITDFYIDIYVTHKTNIEYTAKYGTWFIFTSAIVFSYIWNHPHVIKITVIDKIKTIIAEEHSVSYGVIFVFILFMLATYLLSSTLKRHEGNFIGYSSGGYPIYTLTGETIKRTSISMLSISKNLFKEILTHSDSRSIFYFLCINLAFTFVELLYGAWTNSLGLISDGVHMFFDCSALVMGLFAAVISQWKPTRIYSYGFGRIEVLSGFVNALFLVIISIFVFIESIERLFEPPEINTERLMIVSFGGLLVNMIGIFAFSHAHSHGGAPCPESSKKTDHGHSHSHSHSHEDHGHSHSSHAHSHNDSISTTDNDNMRGVFLHVLADTLGSVGVLISSFLIQQFGWNIADPICSMFIAVMIFLSVIPLIKHSANVLLLRTPVDKDKSLQIVLKKILDINGVISYRNNHLWQLSTSSYVSTIHVQLESNTYEQIVASQIQSILKEFKVANVTIQIEKEAYSQHLIGLGAMSGQVFNNDNDKRVYRSNNDTKETFLNL